MQLIMNAEKNRRHRILFATGTALALLGGAVAAIKYSNFTYWSFSFMVSMAGLWMMRAYGVHSPTRQSTNVEQRPGRLAWLLGVLSILAAGASFFFLWVDAQAGGHWTWPLDAIWISTLACAVTWGYIFAKMGWFIN